MAEKQHQLEVRKNNDQTQPVADRMTFETGLERPSEPALSPPAFQLKADGTKEEKLQELEASESDMSNYLFASGAAALPNEKPSPNASSDSAEVTQQKKATPTNASNGVIQKQGSNLDLLETGGHPKRNQHNRFPVGLLAPIDGASPNYTYIEDGSNLYQDEEGQIWELYPDSKNIFHQPDDWDGNGVPPNKKFLSKDGSGGSYEAILQPDSDGNYTNSWLNTGSKQGTYNFYHPEGVFGNVMHGIFDVLPHFLNDDYDTTPIQKKEANNPPPFQYKASFSPSSSSTPLPEPFEVKLENLLQADFSDVNIYTDSQSATDVGALAYTQGNDIYFAPGQFNPETASGQELIAHEFAHVVQQRDGRVQPTTQSAGIPVNDDRELEREADEVGRTAVQHLSNSIEADHLNDEVNTQETTENATHETTQEQIVNNRENNDINEENNIVEDRNETEIERDLNTAQEEVATEVNQSLEAAVEIEDTATTDAENEINVTDEEFPPSNRGAVHTSSSGATSSVGAGEDASAYPTMETWQQNVSQATSAIPEVTLETADTAQDELQLEGQTTRDDHEAERPDYTESIENALPEAPEMEDEPLVAVDSIEAETQTLLTPHKDLLLPEQQMPALRPTPSGIMPRLGDTPQLVAVENEIARLENEISEETATLEAGESTETLSENQQRLEQLRQIAEQAILENMPTGQGEGLLIEDYGEPPRPALSEEMQTDVGDVLARLLANTDGEAEEMLTSIRKSAFPNNILHRVYADLGIEEIPELSALLSSELEAIAEDAGISEEALQNKIQEEQIRLEEQQRAAEEGLDQCLATEEEQMEQMSLEETGEIQAAKNAADLKAEQQMEAANGQNDPEVIRRKATRLRTQINQEVGQQRVAYDRAKTRREQQLQQTRNIYTQAYEAAALREERSLQQNAATEGENSSDLQGASIRLWKNEQIRLVNRKIAEFKIATENTIEIYKTNIRDAGNQANERIEQWEAEQTGEQKSWWERLWQAITDWFQSAQAEAEAWEQVNIQETRDALTGNLDMLATVRQQLGENVSLEAIEADENLTEEQRAILMAYYGGGADSGDSIAAVATGMRIRLTNQHRPQITEKFLTLLEDKPAEDWRYINQIAISQNSSFNANTTRSELYAAMNGGLTGWGTDEDRVYRALNGLSSIEVLAVRKCYLARHGVSLEDEIDDEFSGAEEDRAEALLAGDNISADAAALHEAIDGWGTDEDAIMRALRGKSEEERLRLAEVYRREYGEDLFEDLEGDLSGHDLDRAMALADGDTALADAIALDQSMNGGLFGWGTDEDAIEGTYQQIRQEAEVEAAARGWNTEQMEAEIARRNQDVEQSFNQEYGDNYDLEDGQSALRAEFDDELSGGELSLANALADNDLIAADAARIAIETESFWYADDDKINDVLEGQHQRAVAEMRRDEWPEIQAELNRLAQEQGWTSQRLREETRRREAALEDRAETRSTQYMEQLTSTYDEEHGGFSGSLVLDIAFNTSGTDQDKAYDLLAQGGRLTPLQQIEYATNGAGTDEDDLRAVFEGKTQEEIAAIQAAWNAAHPDESLEDRVSSELSGRDEHDTEMLMRGLPKTRQEELQNMRDRVAWEQSNSQGGLVASYVIGGPLLGGAIHDNFAGGNELAMMEEDLEFLELQNRILEDPSSADPRDLDLALDLFDQGVTNVETGITAYREQIDSVANTVSSAVAITAAVVVGAILTVVTGGTAAPGVAAAISSLAGGLGVSTGAVIAGASSLAGLATSMATKRIMLGEAYGGEDMLYDAGVGAVDIAAAVATFGVGNAALRGLKIADLAASPQLSRRLFATFVSEGVEGAVSSVPSAITGNILNDANWNGNPLRNIISGTLAEVGTSTAMGVGMGSFGALKNPNLRNIDPDAPRSAIEVEETTIVNLEGQTAREALENNPSGLIHPDGGPLRPTVENNPSGLITPDGTPVSEMPSGLINSDGSPLRPDIEDNPSRIVMPDGTPANQAVANNPSGLVDLHGNPLNDLRPATTDLQGALPSDLQGQIPMHVDPTLNGRTVRVHYDVDANGLVSNVYLRMGANATAADIQLHANTIRTMNKYRGLGGRVRVALDRVRNWVGLNGQPPVGSQAWEARLEIEKLPGVIQNRMQQLQHPDLDPRTRSSLEAEMLSLEEQLQYHQSVFDEMNTGRGTGHVAADDVNDLPTPDEAIAADKLPPLTRENLQGADPNQYAYRRAPIGQRPPDYQLYRTDQSAPYRTLRMDGDSPVIGTTKGDVLDNFSDDMRARFEVERVAAEAQGKAAVPVAGVADTGVSFREVLTTSQLETLNEILIDAYDVMGVSNIRERVKTTIDMVLNHNIIVVRGTSPIRAAHNYRGSIQTPNQPWTGFEIHHIIPLYLGGNHSLNNLLPLGSQPHRQFHEFFEGLGENTALGRLSPGKIQNTNLNFTEGVAIIDPATGLIEIKPLE